MIVVGNGVRCTQVFTVNQYIKECGFLFNSKLKLVLFGKSKFAFCVSLSKGLRGGERRIFLQSRNTLHFVNIILFIVVSSVYGFQLRLIHQNTRISPSDLKIQSKQIILLIVPLSTTTN